MSKENELVLKASELPEGTISIAGGNAEECMRIDKDGTIYMVVDGKKEKCEDFKYLAKAFMYCIYRISPETDWRNLAPEIYEEIKHLIEV